MDSLNYFDILGVASNATTGEIKKAYRRLVLKYHPDHNKSRAAQQSFVRITTAYKVLADPVKKDEYVKGKEIAVTDEPWQLLQKYWEIINETGLRGFCITDGVFPVKLTSYQP